MKCVFAVFIFLLLSTFSHAQKLDAFFKNDQSSYTIKSISDHYFQLGHSTGKIDSIAKANSVILKKEDHYLYMMNEMTRAVFLKHSDDIKGALSLLEKLSKDPAIRKNKKLRAYHHNVSGNVYFQMESFDKAFIHYRKAIRWFKEIKDSSGWKGNLINAGNTYASLKQPDTAFMYYSKAWHLDSLGIKEHHLGLLSNLGRYYIGEDQMEKAIEMYTEVYEYSIREGDAYARMISSINLGDSYYELGEFDRALEFLIDGKQTAIERGIIMHLQDFDRTISRCYAGLHNYEKAYTYLFSSDSAEQKANKRNIEEFAEKLTVKHQNEIHEKENFIFQQAIARKKSEEQLLLTFLAIASILLFLILYLYFQKRKKNRLLAKQNFDLVEQYRSPKAKKSDQKKISMELIKGIETLLHEDGLSRDAELSLDKLAKLLDTNRTYLSENINAYFGYSFRALLNKLRVNDARKLLVSDEYNNYSIEGIAITVGYRNLSSFNAAFKKESGITPSYFRNQKLKS